MTSRNFKTGRIAAVISAAVAAVTFSNTHADPMNVTATVQAVCELGTIGDVNFGNLTPGSGVDSAATGTIQWRCSQGTDAEITINDGTSTNRTMPGPGVTPVAYELYKEAAHSNRWGDSGGEVVSVTGAGMTSFATETVFGEVLHADYVGAETGAYSDVVTVNININ